ncbi:MAG: hypothetical protein JWN98_1333 [Abditibacteriota bacterium]|nr:hypothetical protein [Abditibacteriota bacterium]
MAALTGLGALALYASALSSTVTYGGDSGELIAASYRSGIAHPTGYPLYCLLGRLFASLLPFGEIGWRYNLLSALLGALTVALVAAFVHRVLAPPHTPSQSTLEASPSIANWSALGAGALLAGFYYFGSQALIAEIYALNGFFLALLLYVALRWHQDADWRHAYSLALLLGLSLTAHLSCAFLIPGLLLFAFIGHRDRFGFDHWKPSHETAKRLAVLGALFLAGFSITLYLPLRSSVFPTPPAPDASGVLPIFSWWPLDWGHPVDFAHWKAHITAQQYKKLLFQQPLSTLPAKLFVLSGLVALQLLWATPLLLAGAVRAFQHRTHAGGRWLGAMLALTWLLNIGIQINYNVNDLPNFFFPAYVTQAIWLGLGLAWLLQKVEERATRFEEQPDKNGRSMVWAWRLRALSRATIAATILIQWGIFWPTASLRGDTLARDRALERATALEALHQKSGRAPYAFLISNDSLWTFWYAQYVLNRARNTITPWGALGNEQFSIAPLDNMTARLRAKGPVTFAHWDEAVDARFPFEMLTRSGNLSLASSRALPPPAKQITRFNEPSKYFAPVHRDGEIARARFRRTPLNQRGSEAMGDEDLTDLTSDERSALQREGVASLKREDMAAFEIDFRRPRWLELKTTQTSHDPQSGAIHIGWAEVLLARRGKLDGPPQPDQSTMVGDPRSVAMLNATEPPMWVWKQTRRLIVPQAARAGALLRAAVPLQIEAYAPSGVYDVWTRLVFSRDDRSTLWQRTDVVQLTHR